MNFRYAEGFTLCRKVFPFTYVGLSPYHWHNTTGGDLLKQSELFGTSIFYAHRRAIQLGLIP